MKDLKKYIDKHGKMEGVNENSSEKKKILKLMIKYGDKPKDAKKELEKHYKKAKGDRSKATPSQLAQYIGFLSANESINEKLNQSQAKVLLKQLGGNRFIMMTGAKNFGLGPKGMGFKIGRNSKKINYIRIDLDRGKDLYNMEFIRMARKKGELSPTMKVVKKIKGVYADQLQKMFTKYTGMYTSL